MKFRISTLLLIVFNCALFAFFASAYYLMRQQVQAFFLRNDLEAHQQKVELIGRTLRHNAALGDFVGMRRVFQNTLSDNSVYLIRYIPADQTEGICVGRGKRCYDPVGLPEQSVSTTLYFDAAEKIAMGRVYLEFVGIQAQSLTEITTMYIGGALLVTVMFFNIVLWLFFRAFRRQISWSINAVRSVSSGDNDPISPTLLVEKEEFSEAILELRKIFEEYKREIQTASRKAAFNEVAHQVAHDIRSPLTALKLVSEDLTNLPEERRVLARAAISRIQDIANHLIRPNLEQNAKPHLEEMSAELVTSLVEDILIEKRAQWKENSLLIFESKIEGQYGIFALLQRTEMKRLLSNLVNNAAESIRGHHGLVQLNSTADSKSISITISDNGHGIASQHMHKLFAKGATFNKEGGTGHGLFHAKKCIESWRGHIQLTSKEGKGTSVSINLPRANPPQWYVPALSLVAEQTIIIFDDDPVIHEIWNCRFKEIPHDFQFFPVHFFKTNELLRWFTKERNRARSLLCLVDYELCESGTNGLKLIESLRINEQSILVTNQSEDSSVRAECIRLGVKLVPKTLAPYIPLNILIDRELPEPASAIY